jgi:hypothetical protein
MSLPRLAWEIEGDRVEGRPPREHAFRMVTTTARGQIATDEFRALSLPFGERAVGI